MLIVPALFKAGKINAQLPEAILTIIEDGRNDEISEDDRSFLIDHYQALLEHPLNLNTSDNKVLEESLLFTPFQIYQLLNYRERYGDYFSVHELSSIPGFNDDRLHEIIPFLSVTASETMEKRQSIKFLFMSDIKARYPLSKGYHTDSTTLTPSYAGSPFLLNVRMKMTLNSHLNVAMVYQKDQGETMLLHRRPQFISGYIEVKNIRFIRQMTIGSFKLQSGLGLVAGTGFNQSISSFNLHMIKSVQVKPYASLSEYNYLNGLAFNLRIKQTDILSWISHNSHDLSLFNYHPGDLPDSWQSLFREEGLRRTATEINSAGLAYRQSAGIIINRKFRHLIAGGMAVLEKNGLSKSGMDSLSLSRSNSPLLPIGSAYLIWFNSHSELFLEMAIRSHGQHAILCGTKYRFNDFLDATLLFRKYSNDYSGLHPSGYAMGSRLQNETGPGMVLNIHPIRNFTLKYTMDYCYFPLMKYRINGPSSAFLSKIEVLYRKGSVIFLTELTSKQWEVNRAGEDPGVSPVVLNKRDRLRMQFSMQLTEKYRWNARFDMSGLKGSVSDRGALMYHEINGDLSESITFKFRYLLFGIGEWENRIYIYEPGLIYSFDFPATYGTGSKWSGIFQFRLLQGLRIGIKVSLTTFKNQTEIGSGNDLITGNKRWDIGAQMILKN